jgi:hypothetical protein
MPKNDKSSRILLLSCLISGSGAGVLSLLNSRCLATTLIANRTIHDVQVLWIPPQSQLPGFNLSVVKSFGQKNTVSRKTVSRFQHALDVHWTKKFRDRKINRTEPCHIARLQSFGRLIFRSKNTVSRKTVSRVQHALNVHWTEKFRDPKINRTEPCHIARLQSFGRLIFRSKKAVNWITVSRVQHALNVNWTEKFKDPKINRTEPCHIARLQSFGR